MKVLKIATSFLLAVTFLLAGLAVCLVPPATTLLARATSLDELSPFTKGQLVKVAEATREYTFGSHDLEQLYQVVYDVNSAYAEGSSAVEQAQAIGFPKLELLFDDAQAESGNAAGSSRAAVPSGSAASSGKAATSRLQRFAAVFAGASERYAYTQETLDHLDDCCNLYSGAVPLAITIAVLALVGCIAVRVKGGKRPLGAVLMGAGIGLIAVLAACGVWALLDFQGFFGSLHGLFFAEGTWTFPYDSLLICALPTGFWMGMGIIWLVVTLVVSILSVVVGAKIRK